MKMHQISNFRSQDASKEILSELVRKDVAEFNDKYTFLKMFKGAFNNYSKLKLPSFFLSTPTFCNVL